MLQGKWLRTIAIATALCSVLAQGCKKENGIDNNNVISTPYGLYFSDDEGAMFNTNDGIAIKKVFNTDGVPQRAIVTSGNNVLFVKYNVHLSIDNGNNFNPTDLSVAPTAFWQSLILNVPSHDDRLYLASTRGYGILTSDDHGVTWQEDRLVDTDVITAAFYPTSFAQLTSGDLFAFSNLYQKLYKRISKTDRWHEVASNGLPTHTYFLSRRNNSLLATDVTGGVYFSNDGGQNWSAYSGLPSAAIYATYAPFDQSLLVGTSAGVFKLQQNGTFVASNNGIDAHSIVYSIAGKTDTYKNGLIKQYVYIGTSTGLYRSEDAGQNWVFMDDGMRDLHNNPPIYHDIRAIY